MDFRLAKPVGEYLERKGLLGDCDVISVAGGVKNIRGPEDLHGEDNVLSQLKISADLHNICKVILSNHIDCGAYGGSSRFTSVEEERSFHIAEMRRAKAVIHDLFPALQISIALGIIRGEEFEIEEME